MKIKFIVYSLILFSLNLCAQKQEFKLKANSGNQLQYLVQLPKDYYASDEKWPVVFFLHGAGERGSNLDSLKKWGPPKIATQKDLPFLVVSPQCPEENWWPKLTEDLKKILDEVLLKYRIDESRVYLTGLSMGGFGTFAFAIEYPEYFAAIAPVCGGGNPNLVQSIKDIPAWVFHGSEDKVILPEESKRMVSALKHYNADVKLTIYEGVDHFSWIPAYNESDLFNWFLKHKKNSK